eukprot:1499130-Pyramimonas_sp.AAC.1
MMVCTSAVLAVVITGYNGQGGVVLLCKQLLSQLLQSGHIVNIIRRLMLIEVDACVVSPNRIHVGRVPLER